MVSSHSQGLLIALTDFVERKRGWRKLAASLEGNAAAGAPRAALQDARYVIKSVICDPNFERLVLGCIEADFCK